MKMDVRIHADYNIRKAVSDSTTTSTRVHSHLQFRHWGGVR